MSIEHLFDRTVTFKHTLTTTTDSIGAVAVETEASITARCYLEPMQGASGSEADVDRDTPIGWWLCVTEGDASLSGYDRAVIDGDTYEVFGPPRVFTNPRLGAVSHQELTLRRVIL